MQANQVSAFMATFPDRQNALLESIPSLLRQIDTLYIYLNEYESVPNELVHPKIITLLGKDYEGDIKDNGKIFPFSIFNIQGFCFLVDDDILYPLDYVSQHIMKIKQYNMRIITGVHGVVLRPPIQSYFKDRSVFYYMKKSLDHTVDVLGTGTIAFHTDYFTPSYNHYNYLGMCDILFAIEARQHNMPLLSIERSTLWMRNVINEGDKNRRLYNVFVNNDSQQSTLLRESGLFNKAIGNGI